MNGIRMGSGDGTRCAGCPRCRNDKCCQDSSTSGDRYGDNGVFFEGDIPILPGYSAEICPGYLLDESFVERSEKVSDMLLEHAEDIEEDPLVRSYGLFIAAVTSLFEHFGLRIPVSSRDSYLRGLAFRMLVAVYRSHGDDP